MPAANQGFSIGDHFFRNPYVVTAQPTPLTFPSGRVGPELLMFYKRLARIEPAVILAGPASVLTPKNRNYSLLRADQPKYFEGLGALMKIISGNGTLPGIQLTVPPMQNNPLDWYRQQDPIRTDSYDTETEKVLKALDKACTRCEEVGFGYIELDMSNMSYLMQLWVEEGETLWFEGFDACRSALNPGTILGVRLAPDHPKLHTFIEELFDHNCDVVALKTWPNQLKSDSCHFLLDRNEAASPQSTPSTHLTGIRPDQVFSMPIQ